MAGKKGVSLSVGRGEKLPVSKGAGLTARGPREIQSGNGVETQGSSAKP
jgi:hypothetical protein